MNYLANNSVLRIMKRFASRLLITPTSERGTLYIHLNIEAASRFGPPWLEVLLLYMYNYYNSKICNNYKLKDPIPTFFIDY